MHNAQLLMPKLYCNDNDNISSRNISCQYERLQNKIRFDKSSKSFTSEKPFFDILLSDYRILKL